MTTSFFKIILSTEPRLRLPHKFVSKYNESMPSFVSVGGPHGPAFQVELTPSHGEIWLDKGFGQFMDYYKIQRGYLLILRYHFEDSFFHVTIFDKSATEIAYPFTSFKEKHPEKVSNKSCSLKEETEVISGKISRKREISKGKKLEDDVSIEILEKDRYYEVSADFMNDASRTREMENLDEIETWQKPKKTVKPKKLTAHERAKAFVSTRPSYVLFMHRYYINPGVLSINNRFAKELNKGKNPCDVVLTVPGGTRTWTAKCRIGSCNAKLRWRTFPKDNELCAGDACVFELANGITPSLNVIIFRSTEDKEGKDKK